MSDRIVGVLAEFGRALAKLPKARDEDAMHELAEGMASLMLKKFGKFERRLMFLSSFMAAEPIDQEYVAWVLGGAVPLQDSKYPYWQMFLARQDDTEEDRAPWRRSEVAA